MVNFKTVGVSSAVVVIQAVTLRQKVLDRSHGRREWRTCGFVNSVEVRTAASPCTLIVHGSITVARRS